MAQQQEKNENDNDNQHDQFHINEVDTDESKTTNQQQDNINNNMNNMKQNPVTNDNQNNRQQQQMNINQQGQSQAHNMAQEQEGKKNNNINQFDQDHISPMDKLKMINDLDNPIKGWIKCIQFDGSIVTGMNIKLHLKNLLENDQLSVAKIAEILQRKYHYSCIVYEDARIESLQITAVGVEIKGYSAWLIKDKSGVLIGRYKIMMITEENYRVFM